MFTKTIAAATASALLAGGAVAYSDTGSSTTDHKPKVPQTRGERQAEVAERQAALAKDLGVSAEQLRAADQALLKRRLDIRVAKGTLTIAQRSAVMACFAQPLTCDRTNLPVKAVKKGAKAKAKRKANASKRLDRRAANLATELHLDKDKVLTALKDRRRRG